jgi:hypothetical protein
VGNDIVFTPNDIITVILAISAGIVTLSGAISAIADWINKARQPEYKQNEHITSLEKRVSEHDEKFKEYDNFFKNDDERFNIIEDETKILLKSVHALLKHELDDSDNQVIKDADEKLDAYLLNK